MRICVVHNLYRHTGGEEIVVENVCSLLRRHGHIVFPFFRCSDGISRMPLGRVRAFFSGIYSFSSRRAMRSLLATCRPEVVNVHNLFPWISPSVLGACRRASVPVVMTLHNYRLSCPHGLHMIEGRVCERCTGGREYWCVLRNCEGSVPKSLGYAARSLTARALRCYADNIAIYLVFTQFHRNRLVAEGVPSDRIAVIPHMVASAPASVSAAPGDYVAFAGRVSPEKGVATLLQAARMCLDIPFKIAGSCERMPGIAAAAPENVALLGHLTGAPLQEFYRSARMLVMPSVCFETFGLSLGEAMVWQKPLIVSRLGALAEMVEERVTGLTTEPGNAEELADAIRYLWNRPNLCRQMGQAGREKALREYSPGPYYERLMAVYETAIRLGPPLREGESYERRRPQNQSRGNPA